MPVLERLNRNWQRATFETRLALHNRLSRRSGTQSLKDGEKELIISLTTIKSRLEKVHITIESLLRQQLKPHRVLLWLSGELQNFPTPPALQRQQQRGLELRFANDIGPATKLVHSIREHPDALVATADDDTLYPANWLHQLYHSFCANPGSIHAFRAHWMLSEPDGSLKPYWDWSHLAPGVVGPAHRLFPTGVGGVLYPPKSLGNEVFNEKAMRETCPTNDDIWFKAMALLNKVPAMKVKPVFSAFPTLRSAKKTGLTFINSQANDPQLKAVFQRYDLNQFLD